MTQILPLVKRDFEREKAQQLLTVVTLILILGTTIWPRHQALADEVVLFSDNFNQAGSGLGANKWDNFSGASSPERKTSEDGFNAGVDGTKGFLFEGASGSNPDDGAEREISTKGHSSLKIEYTRALGGFGSGTEFKAQYSLDNGSFVTLETLTSDQTQGATSFDISNPERKTKLTLRFLVNGTDDERAGVDNLSVKGSGAPIFHDGFESDDFATGAWDTQESPQITDTANDIWTDNNNPDDGHAANLDGSVGEDPDDAIVKAQSTKGYQNIQVRYARKTSGMEPSNGDHLRSYYSTNGGANWTTIELLLENTAYEPFVSEKIPSSADDNPAFQIRFEVNAGQSNDNAFIDDVVIWGQPIPTGAITIIKNSVPDDAQEFNFTTDFTENFSLDDDPESETPNQKVFLGLAAGNYTFTENAVEGWELSDISCSGGNTEIDLGSGNVTINLETNENIICTFTNTKRGAISVTKFAEGAQGDFTFILSGEALESAWTEIFNGVFSNGTDSWTFENLLPNYTYNLAEEVPLGWEGNQQVSCDNWDENGSVEIFLNPGDRVSCIFNNTEFGVISGRKYEDRNGNGSYDAGMDQGIGGWTITLSRYDYYDDGEGEIWEEINRIETDAETGEYAFSRLEPGDYLVCESPQTDWQQTQPEEENSPCDDGYGYEIEELEAGQIVDGNDFGNFHQAKISGYKYGDLNGNGKRDFQDLNTNEVKDAEEEWTEPGLLNWEIKATNEEDVLTATTLDDGSYSFTFGAEASGEWTVSETLQNQWIQREPVNPNTYTIEVSSGTVSEGNNFGNQRDEDVPVSRFNNGYPHQVIDTEMVALSLSGQSTDNLSGIDHPSETADVKLEVYKLSGPAGVENYPSDSFFDVFTELSCTNAPRPIETEIIALQLVSVNPLTVTWQPQTPWSPSAEENGPGIYCFRASATDNVGNTEETAWAGPLAYIPVPQISAENESGVNETDFTVSWTTDHPATSRVIYDTSSHETLGDAPNYGYTFSTEETDNNPKVTSHSVTIAGLTSGTTYYYRMVSHGSPENVGGENNVTTANPAPQNSSGGGGGGSGGGGGGGLPPGAYDPPTPPSGGFEVSINNGAKATDSLNVVLALRGGPNTTKMAISNLPDFHYASQEPYQPTKNWALAEGAGTKTVYAKFYTEWGYSSAVISDDIIYQIASVKVAASAPPTPTSLPSSLPTLETNISPVSPGTPLNENRPGVQTEPVPQEVTLNQENQPPSTETETTAPANPFLAAVLTTLSFGTNLKWAALLVALLVITLVGFLAYKLWNRISTNS